MKKYRFEEINEKDENKEEKINATLKEAIESIESQKMKAMIITAHGEESSLQTIIGTSKEIAFNIYLLMEKIKEQDIMLFTLCLTMITSLLNGEKDDTKK